MSVSPKRPSLKLGYQASIAPTVSQKTYAELMKAYEESGKLPRRLEVIAMAVDASMNANHWMVPKEDLDIIAADLIGKQIRKDHSDSVDSIIGKVEESWREDDKVWIKGEIADESIIQKILLGYVNFCSIQLLSDNVLCANCFLNNHKTEVESKLSDISQPCPLCGKAELLVKAGQHPVVEFSIVSLPAYEKAEVSPLGFKASLDNALQERFDKISQASKQEEEVKKAYDMAAQMALQIGTKILVDEMAAFVAAKVGEVVALEAAKRTKKSKPPHPSGGHPGKTYRPKRSRTKKKASLSARDSPPEDCDIRCQGQEPPYQCCGGCPAKCVCYDDGGWDESYEGPDLLTPEEMERERGEEEPYRLPACPECGEDALFQFSSGQVKCPKCGADVTEKITPKIKSEEAGDDWITEFGKDAIKKEEEHHGIASEHVGGDPDAPLKNEEDISDKTCPACKMDLSKMTLNEAISHLERESISEGQEGNLGAFIEESKKYKSEENGDAAPAVKMEENTKCPNCTACRCPSEESCSSNCNLGERGCGRCACYYKI